MNDTTRRILRTTFLIIGTLSGLLGIVTELGFIFVRFVVHLQGNFAKGLLGGMIYFSISLVSFWVVWRLRPPTPPDDRRGFPIA